ncbi:UDP-N-acetylglucosamine 2-epimerase (non-hydrolyzing) [Nitrososphaera sp.]|uniref:non-hydrolyzing UDP-N-acetylglucosamine 2-epimerase n=1 Tax=Nitrososphaera sp. TaxID=1971748 RepID=UPI00307F3F64
MTTTVPKIAVVLGTRPQFIELAPIIHELQSNSRCDLYVYNTGQHYDREMSEVFMSQLEIPAPQRSFGPSSGSHAEQTGRMMVEAEKGLAEDMPDLVVVEGDTNTALAAALAAAKLKIPVAHVEAGCRAHDRSLPEEVNRTLISHMADLHCAPTANCARNLKREGIARNVFQTGHPIVDSIGFVARQIAEPARRRGSYYFMTLHRDFNVDDPARLQAIISQAKGLDLPVCFAVHPRTAMRMKQFGIGAEGGSLEPMPPVDYVTSLRLTKHARAVISDSGGLQKESAILGTPMVTVRPNTEWIETLHGYANQLADDGDSSIDIAGCVRRLNDNYLKATKQAKELRGVFGRRGVSKRIARLLTAYCRRL